MSTPTSGEIQVREAIRKYAVASTLQLYTKGDNEKIIKPIMVRIAQEKKYIFAPSQDLSKIPPFMFHDILEKAVNEARKNKSTNGFTE
jgi:hypothetical protein